MSLPLFRLVIDPNDHTGVTAIALVDNPAIEIGWQAFNKKEQYTFQTVQSKFQTLSAEKRIIAGPLMLANTRIYRKDSRGEFDVIFFPEDIEMIVDKFHRNQYGNNVNPMHDSMLLLPGVYMNSDFIINSERGLLTPKGYDQFPDGSWWGQLKVNNDEIWNEYIKTGLFKGFSVEGFFNEQPVDEPTDEQIQAAIDAVAG